MSTILSIIIQYYGYFLLISVFGILYYYTIRNMRQNRDKIISEYNATIAIKTTILEPIALDLFERIKNSKTTYYVQQLKLFDTPGPNDETILRVADRMVDDTMISISDVLKDKLYKIYNKQLLELNIKQHFLSDIYLLQSKSNGIGWRKEDILDG